MDGRFPFYYTPGSFPMNCQYLQHQSLPVPSVSLAATPSSPAITVGESSVCSDSPRSHEMAAATIKGNTAQSKKQYDKWSNDAEQKTLVSLWAKHHERLESKDSHAKCGTKLHAR